MIALFRPRPMAWPARPVSPRRRARTMASRRYRRLDWHLLSGSVPPTDWWGMALILTLAIVIVASR